MKKFLFVFIIMSVIFFMGRPAMADEWNFAVFGDTRSAPGANSGVNETAVSAITKDISINRDVDFAIVTGDLVYGNGNPNPIATQLTTFKNAAAAGGFKVAGEAGTGVPYYPIRGNHDGDIVDPLGAAWKTAFSTLPQNGPTTNTSGGGNSEVGMTYGFTHNNCLFLGLDSYINKPTYPNQVNQTWVNSQLSGSTADHVFAFGHEPAYRANHVDCLAAYPTARDSFLTSLYDHDGRAYFAGHDHLTAYARANIGGDTSEVFYPIINGAGGAPGHAWNGAYTDPNVTGYYYNSTSSPTYYWTYSIVTVDDDLQWMRLYGTSNLVTPTWLNLYALVISGTLVTDTSVLVSDVANDATINFDQVSDGTYSKVITGTGDIIKSGAGKLILSGVNTYTGTTTVNAGTLLYGINDALPSGAVTIDGSTAILDIATFKDTVGTVILDNGGSIAGTLGTLTSTGTFELKDGSVSAKLGGAGISMNKTTTGTVTLSGANTYTGLTTVSAGELDLNATGGAIAGDLAVSGGTAKLLMSDQIADTRNVVVNSGALDIQNFNETVGGFQQTGGTISGTTGQLSSNTDFDMRAGTVSAILGGGSGLTKTTSGALTLNRANTYSGTTNIQAGTVRIGDAHALGIGNVFNNATLDIGLTALNIGGSYTQGGSATLMAVVNGTASGSIVAGGTCTVNSTDRLMLNVTDFVPEGTTYTIIDGAPGGLIVAPLISVTGNNHVLFDPTTIGDDLILTASRAANGFASAVPSSDPNAAAAGAVLDNMQNPSGDMLYVQNTLEGLSKSEVASSLHTMVPQVDAGILNTSRAALNNFVKVDLERAERALMLAARKTTDSARTGLSSGDVEQLNGLWGKGYGSYLTQGTRKDIQGYDAWNAGTAIGVDHLFSENLTLGISGGYAYGDVNSDTNNATTSINSMQFALYGRYENGDLPYYINAAGFFAYNWYNGQRDINVGGIILRKANAAYQGQQYGAAIEGGYKLKAVKNLQITPITSLQWNHLHLQGYTETEADSLSLSVASQDYDQLQSGLGLRIAAPTECQWGIFTPEIHGKWLYDFIGDPVVMTSNFTGGGAAFASNGAKPAQNSFNAGGQLTFDLKNDVSIIGVCDTELRDDFFGIYGSLTLRREF